VNPTPLIRTLDQEVLALLRGASLECLVCGEFVQHRLGVIACPECGSAIADGKAVATEIKIAAMQPLA
jgi:Zn finger protein HypA/HybF involved in hydrogenase expression